MPPPIFSPPTSTDPIPEREIADKSRITAFSDNVISIAMTLLVLDVRLPGGVAITSIRQAMVILSPRLLSFVLSFCIVGVYWVAHHQMFKASQRVGRPVLWLNNLFLMFISLVPASAAMLGSYPGQRFSAVIYGINLILCASALMGIWNYIVRYHRQFGLALDPVTLRSGYLRTMSGVGIYLVGISLAELNPWISVAVYSITPVMYIVVQSRPAAVQIDAPTKQFK